MNIPMATRPNGQELLEKVLQELTKSETIVIDFGNLNPTPSFVDQCIGGIVRIHGLDFFKSHIKLQNVSEETRPLFKHVILTRAAELTSKK